jgi:hypothetical protein
VTLPGRFSHALRLPVNRLRSSKGTPMIRVPVAVLVATLALAACTAQPTAAPSSVPPVTITATTTVTATVTPTPASPASATNLAFGQAIERPGSARMTVSDFKAFAKGNHDTPLAGAMVQGCSIGSDPIEFSSYPWTLATADGSTFEPMGTFYGNDPVPQYPSQRVVAAGQCVKGWILYELPAGTAITTIRYSNSSSDTPLLGTWKVA